MGRGLSFGSQRSTTAASSAHLLLSFIARHVADMSEPRSGEVGQVRDLADRFDTAGSNADDLRKSRNLMSRRSFPMQERYWRQGLLAKP